MLEWLDFQCLNTIEIQISSGKEISISIINHV
jgi:hypothetical protein